MVSVVMCIKVLVLSFHSFSMKIQMFTNGMSESRSSTIYLTDVSPEAFKAMISFMYSGELNMEDTMNFGTDLIHLLFLADRFGVVPLHQECCKMLLECLSEVDFSSQPSGVNDMSLCHYHASLLFQCICYNMVYV